MVRACRFAPEGVDVDQAAIVLWEERLRTIPGCEHKDWPPGYLVARLCGSSECILPSHTYPEYLPRKGIQTFRNREYRRHLIWKRQLAQHEKRMAQLEDLKKSISDMSLEEAQARLMEIRSNRRKGGATNTAKTKKKQQAKVTDLAALIADMTPAQKAKFLEELG